MRPFHANVFTADGKQAQIIGTKRVRILIGNTWSVTIDVLVASELIKPCILGMDILTICPATSFHLSMMRKDVQRCTEDQAKQREQSQQTPNLISAIELSTTKIKDSEQKHWQEPATTTEELNEDNKAHDNDDEESQDESAEEDYAELKENSARGRMPILMKQLKYALSQAAKGMQMKQRVMLQMNNAKANRTHKPLPRMLTQL